MAQWVEVVNTDQVPEGEKRCILAMNVPLVVCRVAGNWFALKNVCPHAGLPLGEGQLHGHVLTCPFHGYTYNIRNGRNVDWPHDELPVKTYPVCVDGNHVQVNLTPDD